MQNNIHPIHGGLVLRLKNLIISERKITAEIIEMIKDIDFKRIYLDYGYTSMFSFLTKEMGYTPAAAQRRIDAARLCKEVPELHQNLKAGTINLSQVSILAQAVRQKQKEEPEIEIPKDLKKEVLEKVKQSGLVQTQKVIAQELDLQIHAHEKKRYQKDESVRIELTLSKEQFQELERVKELISHTHPSVKLSELIEFLTKAYLKQKDPLKRQQKAESASASVALSRQNQSEKMADYKRKAETNSKRPHISAELRKQLFQRDKCCQWIDPKTKRKCGSKFQLQIDHIEPVWRDGANKIENLQVLCAVHNKLKFQYEVREPR